MCGDLGQSWRRDGTVQILTTDYHVWPECAGQADLEAHFTRAAIQQAWYGDTVDPQAWQVGEGLTRWLPTAGQEGIRLLRVVVAFTPKPEPNPEGARS